MSTLIDTRSPSLAVTEVMQLNGALNFGANVGTIRFFAGDYVPLGTVAADGSVLAVGGGSNLATLLSSSWGGDGTTTFGTPDADGRTLIGQGTGNGLPTATYGQAYGADGVALTQANMPAGFGGSSQSFNHEQPSLATRYFINMEGDFPPRDGTADAKLSYIGMITAWAGGSSPPTDNGIWVECLGQSLSIFQYSALFSLLGTTFGGNGQTTFQLPNLSGRTIAGAGGLVQQGQQDGYPFATLTNAQLPTEMGGGGQSFYNLDPRLAMSYAIAVKGTVPSTSANTVAVDIAMVGEIEAFAFNYAPEGWMLCQGQLLPIASYTDLFTQIGTLYGGDGVTTFALPDLRGRELIGAGNGIAVGDVLGPDTNTLTLDDIPGLTYSGGAADDTLYGGNSGDTISGLDGNDMIQGWGGGDTLIGGNGNDALLGGLGNDTMTGGSGRDSLIGSAGKDILVGGSDRDLLAGGKESDTMTGGLGADTFVFSRLRQGADRILDWSRAEGDHLRIDASGFGSDVPAVTAAVANMVIAAGAGAIASQASAQFILRSDTGQLFYDDDGTGGHAAVLIVRLMLSGHVISTLSAGDFDIVA